MPNHCRSTACVRSGAKRQQIRHRVFQVAMRQPVYDGCAADRTQAVLLQGFQALRRLAPNHRISNEPASYRDPVGDSMVRRRWRKRLGPTGFSADLRTRHRVSGSQPGAGMPYRSSNGVLRRSRNVPCAAICQARLARYGGRYNPRYASNTRMPSSAMRGVMCPCSCTDRA